MVYVPVFGGTTCLKGSKSGDQPSEEKNMERAENNYWRRKRSTRHRLRKLGRGIGQLLLCTHGGKKTIHNEEAEVVKKKKRVDFADFFLIAPL